MIGGKRFLFCDIVAGANSSANLYGLVETAKANGVEPTAYLKTIFSELPTATQKRGGSNYTHRLTSSSHPSTSSRRTRPETLPSELDSGALQTLENP